MPRRRNDQPPKREPRPAPFHAPFRDMVGTLRSTAARAPTQEPVRKERGAASASRRSAIVAAPAKTRVRKVDGDANGRKIIAEDDSASFLSAMSDVRRLPAEGRVDAPPPALGLRRARVGEEAEALAALSDFVAGVGEFDVSDSTEYVEGAVVGLDTRILRRLRRGEFAYQAYVDLHGMSAAAARVEVERFVSDAFVAGHRAVLIVHGRGRNSKDNVPVLKQHLKSWLARGRIGRVVLAFTSARPADGGTGALYVLLRRRRTAKEPIAVLEGAKRE
jgi:DNA-nicking Smr family endonuclease